ncbi:MAG: hypothetical protein KGI71_06335, partial [Patescibacteria group bacterium]|nr:hypothetical protein [Patescibacteria group bacterium]
MSNQPFSLLSGTWNASTFAGFALNCSNFLTTPGLSLCGYDSGSNAFVYPRRALAYNITWT